MTRFTSLKMPLRLRLTLWYTFSLTLILILFSIFIYFQLRKNLFNQVDMALALAANQASLTVQAQGDRLSFQINDQNSGALANLSDDYIIQLSSEEGQSWDYIAADDENPIRSVQGAGFQTLDHEQEPWRVYRQPISQSNLRGWIQVAQELDPLESILASLQAQFLIGLPLALLLAGIGGYFLAAGALRPIDKITRTAQAINASQLTRRIHYQGPMDEVGRLAKTFDTMLDRLQAAFNRERRFTSDAAHELRTPLTALKGQIGVTLSRPRPPQIYQETLQGLEQEVDRLIRLSNDLLFMARLEQDQAGFQGEVIDLAEFLSAVVDQLRALVQAKAIDIEQKIPSSLQVLGDMQLLLRLFMNILHNALKFTPRHGRVILTAERHGDQVFVHVSDNGPGISPEHLPQIFERFYRPQPDRTRKDGEEDQGGAGLGLAIAREIARHHQGDLQVSSEPGQGTTFTVLLPAGG